MELDTGLGFLCARIQENAALAFPTFALAYTVFEDPTWDVRSPDRPLRFWRLLEVNQAWGQPLSTAPLRADEWVVNHVKGLGHLDERLGSFVTPVPVTGTGESPGSQRLLVEQNRGRSAGVRWGAAPPVVEDGREEQGSRRVAVADQLHRSLFRLQAETLPVAQPNLRDPGAPLAAGGAAHGFALLVDTVNVNRATDGPSNVSALPRPAASVVLVDAGRLHRQQGQRARLRRGTPDGRNSGCSGSASWGRAPGRAGRLAARSGSVPNRSRLARSARQSQQRGPLPARVRYPGGPADAPAGSTRSPGASNAQATSDELVLPSSELRLLRRSPRRCRADRLSMTRGAFGNG